MALFFPSCLARQSRARTIQDTYTTAVSIINPEDRVDLNRGFWVTKRGIWLRGGGALKNTTGNPTIQFLVKLGTIASPVTVYDSGALQFNASAHAVLPFSFDIWLRTDKDNMGDATTGKLFGRGIFRGIQITKTSGQTDSLQGDQVIHAPQVNPVLGGGFDMSIVNTLDFWAGISSSSSLNGVRMDDYAVIDEGVANPTQQ
jgi:hypothetical protein